ncbi:hypothetical protein PVV74_03910 [Roseovarius sp. SK2]|uniref:hypothetical protein n=1 Tax=Roseovarius TaxID=74030 RepID=UPI00237BC6AA|nr:hypothetical protein [Roseovarius sp. SK2]MDD9724595.1 hypothetical protein [Roseovarius sp. SK2]
MYIVDAVDPRKSGVVVRGGELMQAVRRLTRHFREMLVVVVTPDDRYLKAAELFGVRIGTVKSRTNRARAMVVADLEGRAPNDRLSSEPFEYAISESV